MKINPSPRKVKRENSFSALALGAGRVENFPVRSTWKSTLAELDFLLAPQQLSDTSSPPDFRNVQMWKLLSPIWFTCSSFRPGLLASTPFLSTIPEVKVRDLIQSPSALWHNLLLLAFRFIPLQPHCYSSVISSVLPLGLYTYCSLCLECSSSRWPCGLLPYFLQFSSQMQFQYLTNLYKIATASHYLTPYHLGLY